MGKKVVLGAALLLLVLGSAAVAQESSRAGLVVSLGDGVVETRCVEFDEAEINGYELLTRSGFALQTELMGAIPMVCRIADSGCPSSDCLCACKGGGDCIYWSYWLNRNGEWRYSQVGASLTQVEDGDIQGWVWGLGSPNQASPPPALSFADICAEPGAVAQVEQATAVLSPALATSTTFSPAAAEPLTPTDERDNAGASIIVLVGGGIVLGVALLATFLRRGKGT